MKKLLFALTILIMVTIPVALAGENDVSLNDEKAKGSPTSFTNPFTGIVLDLAQEKLVGDTQIAAIGGWGTDGTKWKVGAPTDADIVKFLNKGGTLWLIDNLDGKKADVEGGYCAVAFEAVKARPKANPDKTKPYYATSTSVWYLAKKGATTAHTELTKYEYTLADATTGKLPETVTWIQCDTTGFAVESAPAKGTKKTTYFFRVAPTGETAGSKPWKVTPAVLGKAPKLKIDYKKEVLKIKKNMNVDSTYYKDATATSMTDKIGTEIGSMTVSVAATGKKPASEVQTLAVFKRSTEVASSFTCEKGKIKDPELKKYEFSSDNGKTWGKLPAFSATKTTCLVRKKADAKTKINAEGVTELQSGGPASASGTLTITWAADYDTEKEGNQAGITAATISWS